MMSNKKVFLSLRQISFYKCLFSVCAMMFLFLITWSGPTYAAPLCSNVFPAAITEEATTTLDLPPFPANNDGDAEWKDDLKLAPGTYYFEDLEIANNVKVTLSGPVLIYVESGVDIGNNVVINAPGNPADFVLISYDDIDVGNNAVINGILYAQEDVDLSNGVTIRGAVTGVEEVDIGQTTSVTYDPDAVNTSLLAGLCEGPDTPLLAIETFESYPVGSIEGMAGGTGWGGSWQGGAGQSIVDNFSNPLIYDDGAGRSIRSQRSLQITGNNDRMATRLINSTFSGDRYFASMLVRFEGPVQNNDFLGFWVDSPGYGDSPQFGIKTNEGGGGNQDFFVRLDQSTAYSDELVPGETYFLVAEFSKNSTDFFNDSKLWVNPSCDASPPPPSAQITRNPANPISSFSEIGLRTTNLDSGQRVQIGQLAAGENWEDVVRCSPGPLLSYRMEEEEWNGVTGEVLDGSGYSRHGTVQGEVSTEPNDLNGAAIPRNPGTCGYGVFAGGGIRENNAGSYLNGLEAITVMTWVYNTAPLAGNNRGIFTTASPTGRDNRLALRYDTAGHFTGNTNVIKASVFTEDCVPNRECLQVETESNVMVVDQWQHVAMTWSRGGLIRVFVDGLPVGTSVTRSEGGDGPLAGVDWLDIGLGAQTQRWQGRMDEFRIFGYAMTDAEIAAEMNRTFSCGGPLLDHIRIEHDGAGLTCQSETITIRACADANCVNEYTEEMTVNLTSPASGWSPDPVTFSGGSATVELVNTSAGTVTLDAEATAPTASDTLCINSSGGPACEMVFADVGVLIDADDSDANPESSIGTQIAGKPSNVSPPGPALQQRVRVVRTDDQTGACVAAVGNVTIDAVFRYLVPTPTEGLNDNTFTVTGTSDADMTAVGSGATVSLAFDGNGTAPFHFVSADAGRYLLQVDLEIPVADVNGNPTGETMPVSDTSNQFVVRPLAVFADANANPQAQNAAGDVFKKAGESFPLTYKSLRWTAGRDGNNDGLWDDCDSSTLADPGTPLARVPVWTIGQPAVDLVLPAGGNNPALSYADGNVSFVAGETETTAGDVSYSEVGIIQLRADGMNAFLGENVEVCSPYIGRFTPDHFETTIVNNGVLQDGCSGFTYSGQPFTYDAPNYPDMLITAVGNGGNTTLNYRDDFVKLTNPATQIIMSMVTNDASNLGADGTSFLRLTWFPGSSSLVANNDGTLNFSLGVDEFIYTREANALVAPIDSDIRLPVSSLADSDGVIATDLPRSFIPAATEIRYGRMLLQNAHGPETQPLTIPVRTEYYTGSAFTLNESDNCTAYDSGSLSLTMNLADSGTTTASGSGTLVSGLGNNLRLSAPGVGHEGSVDLELDLSQATGLNLEWLQPDGNNPTAKATFGIFKGNPRLIYMRESVW